LIWYAQDFQWTSSAASPLIRLPSLATFTAHGETIASYFSTSSITTTPTSRYATAATGTTNRNAVAPNPRLTATTAAAGGRGQ
jgi:hypothetical protein